MSVWCGLEDALRVSPSLIISIWLRITHKVIMWVFQRGRHVDYFLTNLTRVKIIEGTLLWAYLRAFPAPFKWGLNRWEDPSWMWAAPPPWTGVLDWTKRKKEAGGEPQLSLGSITAMGSDVETICLLLLPPERSSHDALYPQTMIQPATTPLNHDTEQTVPPSWSCFPKCFDTAGLQVIKTGEDVFHFAQPSAAGFRFREANLPPRLDMSKKLCFILTAQLSYS